MGLRSSRAEPGLERTVWRLERASKISLCSSSISVTNTACEVLHFKARMPLFYAI
jgi:hypothetical protein